MRRILPVPPSRPSITSRPPAAPPSPTPSSSAPSPTAPPTSARAARTGDASLDPSLHGHLDGRPVVLAEGRPTATDGTIADDPDSADSAEVDLDEAYALPPAAARTAFVRSNFVASIDGAAEVGGRSGPLGGAADWRVFRLLRWLSDVVLVGAGTARTEDYGPVVVPPERRELRVAAGLAAVPPVAVVSRALSFDPSARLFSGEVRPLLLTCEAAPLERRQALEAVADIVICGEVAVEPARAVAALAERGLTRILTEGGPLLHAELAAAGLLDELCLTIAPVLAGPGRLGVVQGLPWTTPIDLTLTQVLTEDGVLFLRYQRR